MVYVGPGGHLPQLRQACEGPRLEPPTCGELAVVAAARFAFGLRLHKTEQPSFVIERFPTFKLRLNLDEVSQLSMRSRLSNQHRLPLERELCFKWNCSLRILRSGQRLCQVESGNVSSAATPRQDFGNFGFWLLLLKFNSV